TLVRMRVPFELSRPMPRRKRDGELRQPLRHAGMIAQHGAERLRAVAQIRVAQQETPRSTGGRRAAADRADRGRELLLLVVQLLELELGHAGHSFSPSRFYSRGRGWPMPSGAASISTKATRDGSS